MTKERWALPGEPYRSGKGLKVLFDAANRSEPSIDIQPILKLLYSEEAQKRKNASVSRGDQR
jgi:hypothetical protein